MEQAMVDRLEIHTRVFVEYQSDGTWYEACKDRMYARGYHAASRRAVPLNQRQNPELVRVHDTDAVFRPVRRGSWVRCMLSPDY